MAVGQSDGWNSLVVMIPSSQVHLDGFKLTETNKNPYINWQVHSVVKCTL